MGSFFKDKKLVRLWEKIRQGSRLTVADGLAMFRSDDLLALGMMAEAVQHRINGDAVYFAVNQKIEPSNVCALACRFCNFSVKEGGAGAYSMEIDEIIARISPEIREVHITGSLHPRRSWDYYVGMVRAIKSKFPEATLKAFTAVEIDFFHKKFRMPVREVLKQLQAEGLDTMPGGGAEVFSERVRKRLFPRKIGGSAWLNIHATAHRLGIPTNATMLYGHIETYEERLRHMILLRELQDRTGGFLSFVPLAFQPGTTGIGRSCEDASSLDDLKTIAVSRIMLDNIPHIKAYWVTMTEETAAVALGFGADDLEGTVGGERIVHDAGAASPMSMAKDSLIRIISDAGKIPVERNGYYHPLEVYRERVIGKIPYLNSVPFYNYLERGSFRVLPVVPRHMGVLSRKGRIAAGPFSLMDYLSQETSMELMDYCIAVEGTVKSVMLFSSKGWTGLEGKRIGITDDTATSVQLLRVLLHHKYGIQAEFTRLSTTSGNCEKFDALLFIGDEALKRQKYGLSGFPKVFDLALEWYDWQRLPFVFAVWAQKKSLPSREKTELKGKLRDALNREILSPSPLNFLHGRHIGLTPRETRSYLEGFTFRLGKREREAVNVFRKMVESLPKDKD